MVAEASSVSQRRARSDARRNRGVLLAAATSVFAEQGAGAALEEVARRAGVGIGTLYRHFPTRQALLEEAMRDGLDQLTRRAEELEAAPGAGRALTEWLRSLVTQTTAFQGLGASVMVTMLTEGTDLYSACHAMRDAAARLLRRAQEAGEVRDDVELTELLLLAHGVGWATGHVRDGSERTDRLLAFLFEGLRPRRP